MWQNTVLMMFIIMKAGTVIWNSTDVHVFGRQSLKVNLWAKCWSMLNINVLYGVCPTENEPADIA